MIIFNDPKMKEALLCKNWQKARQKTILATIITKGHLTLMKTKRTKKQKHSKYFWLLTTDVSANDIIVFYDTLVTKELQYTGTNGNIWYVLRLVNSKVIFFSIRFLSFDKISFFQEDFLLLKSFLSYVKISLEKISFGKISLEKISFGKISLEKISFENIFSKRTSFEKISFKKISFEKIFFAKIYF